MLISDIPEKNISNDSVDSDMYESMITVGLVVSCNNYYIIYYISICYELVCIIIYFLKVIYCSFRTFTLTGLKCGRNYNIN